MTLDHVETSPDQLINHKVSALFVFLLAVFVYMFFALQTAEAATVSVQVSVNGLTTTRATDRRTVGELLDELYPDAGGVVAVSPSRATMISPHLNIAIDLKPTPINQAVAVNLNKSKPEAEHTKPPLATAKLSVAKSSTPAVVEPKSPTYSGTATWYRFGTGLTTASTQFPKGTRLRVIADGSNKSVDVVINDYGPTADTGVSLDLNKPAFMELAPLGAGRINVHYYVI